MSHGGTPGRGTAGSRTPSTVYRDPDGSATVLRNAQQKQYLSRYDLTWIDQDHVVPPPGVGGFD